MNTCQVQFKWIKQSWAKVSNDPSHRDEIRQKWTANDTNSSQWTDKAKIRHTSLPAVRSITNVHEDSLRANYKDNGNYERVSDLIRLLQELITASILQKFCTEGKSFVITNRDLISY